MKVSELLEERRRNWQELESMCVRMERRRRRDMGSQAVHRFAALYRAACADLALADAYQLPANTVQYLHRLVGRAHNQLYRSRVFDVQRWVHVLFYEVPQGIFRDRCVQICFCLFWGVFILSAVMASRPQLFPGYAEQIMTQAEIDKMEDSFSEPLSGRDPRENAVMLGYYIWNNTGIGLKCFAYGIAVVPGLLVTIFNAASLGAAFGHMARPDVASGENFFEFVMAHGPFELTAIVLSAGAGLRLGTAWLMPGELTRRASLVKTGRAAMPVMGSAMILFFLAALIEGFVSPSGAHQLVKAAICVLCSGLLMFYFVILGYPRRGERAT